MDDHIAGYVEMIHRESEGQPLHVEQKVRTGSIEGTPDVWFVTDECLNVWDLKYGYIPVEAYGNWQEITYAIGIIESNIDVARAVNKVRLGIYQPRAFHMDGKARHWDLTIEELYEWWAWALRSAIEAKGPNPQTASGSHCKYCTAIHVCHSAAQAASIAVDISCQAAQYDRSPEQLAYELAVLEDAEGRITALKDALEAHATAQITSGQPVPGWTIGHGRGTKKWISDPIAFGELIGIPLSKPKALTPNQAIKAGVNPETVAAMTETTPGKRKLIRENPQRAKQIFGKGAR